MSRKHENKKCRMNRGTSWGKGGAYAKTYRLEKLFNVPGRVKCGSKDK